MQYEEKIEKLKSIFDNMKRGVLFTGAGISVPSGIPDFRSATGLYNTKFGNFPAETMLSHTFFERLPEEFFRFYKEKMIYRDAKPNDAHRYFADLEKQGKLYATVTQNIDGLHQQAGAKKVFELHGSVHRNYCNNCGKKYSLDYVMEHKGVPKCEDCGAIVRPDVVLYEEGLDEDTIEGAVKAIMRSDTLIIVGTSLAVYPAAGLINYFNGDNLILLNKGKTERDNLATLAINEDIEKIVHDLQK